MAIEYTNYLLNGGEQLLSLAMRNTIMGLIVFTALAAAGAFIFVKHEEKKKFETELRRKAQRNN